MAIVDLFSRNVFSCNLSNKQERAFCLKALQMAMEGRCHCEAVHSDQGCQFSSTDIVTRLQTEDIKINYAGSTGAKSTSSIISMENVPLHGGLSEQL